MARAVSIVRTSLSDLPTPIKFLSSRVTVPWSAWCDHVFTNPLTGRRHRATIRQLPQAQLSLPAAAPGQTLGGFH
jgi:hypothetical protein